MSPKERANRSVADTPTEGRKIEVTTLKELSEYIQKEQIDFVDAVFCDPVGVWQHYTFAAEVVQKEEDLKNGFAFDGSSITLFTTVDQSDMFIIPDPTTCWIDPFYKRKTVHILCDVVHPDGRPFMRCPRQIARRTVEAIKAAGVADQTFFGPEPEFFVFDDVRFSCEPQHLILDVDSAEGPWNTASYGSSGSPNLGHIVPRKRMYVPVAPIDTLQELRGEMLLTMRNIGMQIEKHHHEVASAQCELGFRFDDLVTTADNLMTYKYIVRNVAKLHGKSATFLPKPIFGDNGSGCHVHQSLWRDGVNLFYAKGSYANLSDTGRYYIGGILKHAAAVCAFSNPTTNSYKRLVPGYEAPCKLAYSQGNRSAAIRVPLCPGESPAAKRLECRFPDPSSCPYLLFSVLLLAGADGIINKIDPPSPVDRDIFTLPKEERDALASTPASLTEALDALEKDHDFLLLGDAFSEDFIKSYIAFKREEVKSVTLIPHPKEFELYYHI